MERSIILSKEEVKWILCGTKTSIRRLIPEQPLSRLCYTFAGAENGTWGYPSETAWNYWGDDYRLPKNITKKELSKRWSPIACVDDILYVREPWYNGGSRYMYRADYSANEVFYKNGKQVTIKWRPASVMPKDAARIRLKVKNVSIERLQDITSDGIRSEGLTSMCTMLGDTEIARAEYKLFWDSTPAAKKYSCPFDKNPFVWVIEFEKM